MNTLYFRLHCKKEEPKLPDEYIEIYNGRINTIRRLDHKGVLYLNKKDL